MSIAKLDTKREAFAYRAFHIFAAVHFMIGLYYDWFHVKPPKEAHIMGIPFGGKFKFLTFWDAVLQSVFFIVCVLNDLIGSNEMHEKKPPVIRRLKDTIMTCLAFPLSMFVGVTFWALYAVDRELVFPRSLDPFFPTWLNHVMHTNIMIFILIEMYWSFRVYPRRKQGLSVLLGFMLCYLVWMHIVYYKTNIWVYPIMEVLGLPLRILFFVFLFALVVILYMFGENCNKFIWSKELQKLKAQ